jgi:AcrR family transcriptional regulator
VIDAAVQLFAEKGYDGTSLLDIADAVGLLKGSLYYYARSKEDLLFAIVEEFYAEGLASAAELRDSAGTPTEKLRRSLERAAHYMLTHRAQVTIYFHDAKALSAERQALLAPQRSTFGRTLAELIKAGQQTGEFRPDVEARIASVALVGSINWLAMQDPADAPTAARRRRFVDDYCDLLLKSVTHERPH